VHSEGHDRAAVRAELVGSVPDAVFHLDRDWRITYANAASEQMLGRSVGELLGRSFREALPQGVDTLL
jgi:PAS domain S-box-containing protein